MKKVADRPAPVSLGGNELLAMGYKIVELLRTNRKAIDSINVYPVPDGDTGTNMLGTMIAAMGEARRVVDSSNAGAVAQAMAQGALMGAKGNSGLILSQILNGVASRLSDKGRFDVSDFAEALGEGARVAWAALSDPREGTILSVAFRAAAAAERWARRPESLLAIRAAVIAARTEVEKSRYLLPELRKAGVVDAGGQGLYIILTAVLLHQLGEDTSKLAPFPVLVPSEKWRRETAALHGDGETGDGFCTEFLVIREGTDGIDREMLRKEMLALGSSVSVSDEDAGRVLVHLHTQDPDEVLERGGSFGEALVQKTDDLRFQEGQFLQLDEELPRVGTVAVVPSVPGLMRVLREVGVMVIVPGGRTMNPNVEQIYRAISLCPQGEVVVLPDHGNVIMIAQQAAELANRQVGMDEEHPPKRVRVVPTTSVPQAVAALLALSPEAGLEEAASAMEDARQQVVTAEFTRATRSVDDVDGVKARVGQAIGLVDGKLCVARNSLRGAVLSYLKLVVTPQTSLVTIYYGANMKRQVRALVKKIMEEHPHIGVQDVEGGQKLHPYIVSVE